MEKEQKTHSNKILSFFRAHQRLIAAGCLVILAVFIIQLVYMRQRESVFLRSARLESSASLPARTDYQYWTDILKYTDGCEIMTFQLDQAGAWAAPAEWVKEQVSLRTLTERFGISIHPNYENILNPDSTVCDAWYVQARAERAFRFISVNTGSAFMTPYISGLRCTAAIIFTVCLPLGMFFSPVWT